LSGCALGCQDSAIEKIDDQPFGGRTIMALNFSAASAHVGPIRNTSPEIGNMLGIDTQVCVAAQIQYDGAIVELTAVRVNAKKIRRQRSGFRAYIGGGVGNLAWRCADLHGITHKSRSTVLAANRRLRRIWR
jgi:hypothetical protein